MRGGGCEDGSSPQGEDEKFCGSKLTSLDASFGKEGGDVVIGNTKIVAPPNSEVSFKEGDEFVSIMFKDGGKIESFPVANSASDDGISPVKYSGKFELPGGQEVDGDLIYNTENERMYLMKNEGIIDYDTTIDGVTVSSKYDENVEIFLDKDLITSDLKNFALIDDDVFLSNGVNAHLDDVNGNVIDVPNNPEAYYTITRNKDDSFSRILAYGETSEVNINNDVFERNGDNLLYHTTRTRDEKFVKASSVVGSGASSGSDISDINPSPKLEFEDLINEFTDKKESIKNEASRIQILRNQRVIYQTLDSGASAEIQAKDANRLLNIELDRISKESPSASSNVLKEDGDLDAYPEIVADYHKDGIAYYKNNPSRASMFYFLTN